MPTTPTGSATRATLIAQAIAPLDRAESPYALAARRYKAIGAYFANDFSPALEEIRAVQGAARRRHYTRLLGLAYRLEGLIDVVRGDFAKGIDAYEAALACFNSVGAIEDEAAIQTSLAEEFDNVGDMQRSWQARYAALSVIIFVHDPLWRLSACCRARRQRRSERKLPEVALHFQQAALESAQRTGRSPAVVTGYITRAAINKRLGEVSTRRS